MAARARGSNCLPGRPSSIHGQIDPCHVGRSVRCQEQQRPLNFRWLADPKHWILAVQVIVKRRIPLQILLNGKRAGTDAVDAYLVSGKVARRITRELDYPRFGSTI